ncbi:hypothetical protein EDEG_01865 [Edhazardia aedis USNM 41457]|uniref:Uncharacterized protein n=1 Tax=Edhazardia aedis (strain USNM 41457) TaxID=1003232 RepID=J9D8J0_EDHAE|nr:hypothetical protein EDEG_01865 [Edhazardia aedis USNM 41457]|eukprot:EJW03839.1 hypothetical protein EDEG_01865 [Edhazardia aedis USNM 41457]
MNSSGQVLSLCGSKRPKMHSINSLGNCEDVKIIADHKNHYKLNAGGVDLCFAGNDQGLVECDDMSKKNELWRFMPHGKAYKIYSDNMKSENGEKKKFCLTSTPESDLLKTALCEDDNELQNFKIKKLRNAMKNGKLKELCKEKDDSSDDDDDSRNKKSKIPLKYLLDKFKNGDKKEKRLCIADCSDDFNFDELKNIAIPDRFSFDRKKQPDNILDTLFENSYLKSPGLYGGNTGFNEKDNILNQICDTSNQVQEVPKKMYIVPPAQAQSYYTGNTGGNVGNTGGYTNTPYSAGRNTPNIGNTSYAGNTSAQGKIQICEPVKVTYYNPPTSQQQIAGDAQRTANNQQAASTPVQNNVSQQSNTYTPQASSQLADNSVPKTQSNIVYAKIPEICIATEQLRNVTSNTSSNTGNTNSNQTGAASPNDAENTSNTGVNPTARTLVCEVADKNSTGGSNTSDNVKNYVPSYIQPSAQTIAPPVAAKNENRTSTPTVSEASNTQAQICVLSSSATPIPGSAGLNTSQQTSTPVRENSTSPQQVYTPPSSAQNSVQPAKKSTYPAQVVKIPSIESSQLQSAPTLCITTDQSNTSSTSNTGAGTSNTSTSGGGNVVFLTPSSSQKVDTPVESSQKVEAPVEADVASEKQEVPQEFLCVESVSHVLPRSENLIKIDNSNKSNNNSKNIGNSSIAGSGKSNTSNLVELECENTEVSINTPHQGTSQGVTQQPPQPVQPVQVAQEPTVKYMVEIPLKQLVESSNTSNTSNTNKPVTTASNTATPSKGEEVCLEVESGEEEQPTKKQNIPPTRSQKSNIAMPQNTIECVEQKPHRKIQTPNTQKIIKRNDTPKLAKHKNAKNS